MSDTDTARRDFFISRAGEDKEAALWIDRILREAGYTTFIQDKDFGPASFMARMAEGWSHGGKLICVLSNRYQKSEYCKKEYEVALKGDPRNLNERVIVLRIEDCAPVEHLADLAYVDLVPLLNDAAAVRKAVLGAVDPEAHRPEASFAALHMRSGKQIIHPEVRPVPGFTAREDELAGIDGKLWRSSGRAALTDPGANALSNSQSGTAAVRGLGGVGKSVLAQQYAWENRERYQGVWWVRAETRETLLDDLVELGIRFNDAIGAIPDREAAANLVLDHIAQTAGAKPWLIVYDNVESPDAIDRLTPAANAHVLVTTRWPDWFGHAEEVPVGVFPPKVAVEFLLSQARGLKERPEATHAEAAQLAEDLGRLPLALAIARAHAWQMNWTFAQYREHLTEMLERAPARSVDYPRSVAATFALAIDKANATSPEAEKLLAISAFLAPDRIPLDLFTDNVMSEIEKGEAVAALAEVSLVTQETLDDGTPGISVHRLVQTVMRGRLAGTAPSPRHGGAMLRMDVGEGRGEGRPPAPEQAAAPHPSPLPVKDGEREYAALATTLVAKAYPHGDIGPVDVRSWPACRRLEPHAVAVLAHAPDAGEASDKTSRLLNQYAVHLNARADFAAAEPLMRRALAIDEKSFGPEHPDVAIDLNNLAALLKATNRLGEAEPLMRRALAIDETSFGTEHPNVAIRLNNLAVLLEEGFGNYAESEKLKRRALAIDEASFGPAHPNVAIDLNNLAQLLQDTNRPGEAEPLMRRALAIDEASFGPEHPNVARDLNNLAQLLQATNRPGEAEPLMRRALAIDEKSFAPEHPIVAIRLNNLAQLLKATNRLGEAEPLMRRALAIDEASLGTEHPNVAIRLNNLAQLLKATNRLGEAEPLMRRALAIDEVSLGPDHPNVARDLNNLALLLQATNRLGEAEPLMRRALAIFEASLGADHPNTGVVAENLAALISAMNASAADPSAEPVSSPPPPSPPPTDPKPAPRHSWWRDLLGRK